MLHQKHRLFLKFYKLLFLLFLSSMGALHAQMSATATLDTNKILIGGQTKIKLSVTAAASTTLQWPALKDSIQKIELVSIGKIDTVLSEDRKFATYLQTLAITCFDSGLKAIPPFVFTYKNPGDTATQRLSTEALLVSVQGLVVDTTKAIKDIKPPLEIPFSLTDFVKENIYIIAPLLVALALAVWWFLFRKKPIAAAPVAKPVPERPAHIIALEGLKNLEQKKLWQEGAYKPYHSELADVVRTYIENRYAIMAMELTTDETLTGLKVLDAGHKEKLRQILILADLVKFAKAEPLHYENDLSLKNAYEFVKSTISTAIKEDTK